jgi:hypothetical protein
LTRQALVARILAVVGPLLVLGACFGALIAFDPPVDDVREWRRAGRTMNGEVFRRDVSTAIASGLAQSERRVLVLGNSFANANLDPDELARQIGIRPVKVGVIAIPNSVSSHWYAILENAVFGPGYRPELIVVVSSLQAMLTVEPYSEVSRQNLLVHLRPSEPVLDRYVARGPPWLERWSSQRLLWRQAALDTLRDRSVGLVFAGDTEAAMRRVFREDELQRHRDAGRSVPVVGLGEGGQVAPVARSSVERSLLGELSTLCEDHGAGLLMIRPPSAPRTPRDLRDVVGEGVPEAAAALLAERGHRLLDEVHRKLPRGAFDNPRHMTAEGATTFTGLIGDDLRRAWEAARRPRR